jgi:molybdopterin-guanine dinucleotide biosynthesis protein A
LSFSPPAEHDAIGFVLAGGQSSRMGRDKAMAELDGRTLAAGAVDLLRTAGLAAVFAGARSELADLAPVVFDDAPDLGPLSGICSGLASMKAEYGVFIPVDMPFLPASLLKYMLWYACITGRAVTLVSANGFTQTFPVVLRRETLPGLQSELAAGRRGCLSAFHAASKSLGEPVRPAPVELLAQAGHAAHPRGLAPFQWFLNVNTPPELERARSSIA